MRVLVLRLRLLVLGDKRNEVIAASHGPHASNAHDAGC